MLSTTVKKENISDDEDMRDDSFEAEASSETKNSSSTKEHEVSPIKEEEKETTTTDSVSSKEDTNEDDEMKDDEEENQDGVEIEPDSDSSVTEVEIMEEKSIVNNNWDNGYSNELQKMYSNVDPDTRAVAEKMIRAVQGLNKKDTSETKKDVPKDVSLITSPADDVRSSPTISTPGVSEESSTPSTKDDEKDPATNDVNKGKEPSALELALKQQGISQSDQLRSTQFPFRLHNMLDDAERSGHGHIVSWCAGGDCFKIHKPGQLINVLQKYFRQSKFKSFLRQLQGYNFKRVTRGKDQGVVSHPLFLRGRRSVSTLMRRKRVGPKMNRVIDPEPSQSNKISAVASRNIAFKKNEAAANRSPKSTGNTPILPQGTQGAIALSATKQKYLNHSQNPPVVQSTQSIGKTINPNPQDVLCVDFPNSKTAQHFQGNRKLSSIVQKITGHYTSANESVRTMIVHEISSRIQNSGSRFLKLNTDGVSWVECTREEMFRKVISCFEQEIQGPRKKAPIDLTGESEVPSAAGITMSKAAPGLAMPALHCVVPSADHTRRLPPRSQDVVLRGGPRSEREGNDYLKTMIQSNVGQQAESFEMKRIKCRAILERMKRRGSRFFLKLKEADPDDEMYILSDTEAQDVIYTAFCAEEKKIQSLNAETSNVAAMLRAKALAGLDVSQSGLSALSGASQYAARAAAFQSDAALLSQLKAKGEMNLLAAQSHLKQPLQGHPLLLHENMLENRLRAETDEHIKLLIEREHQRRTDPYGTNAALMAANLPLHARSAILESSLPLTSAYSAAAAAATNSTIDQYLKERQADELLLKSAAAAQAPFAAGVTTGGVGAEQLPKSNNHFVEFLKKKYVKSAQDRNW